MNANILDLLCLSCYVFVKCANYPKFIIHQQINMLFCCLIAVQLLAAQKHDACTVQENYSASKYTDLSVILRK